MIWSYLTKAYHKKTGQLYLLFGLVFTVLAFIMALYFNYSSPFLKFLHAMIIIAIAGRLDLVKDQLDGYKRSEKNMQMRYKSLYPTAYCLGEMFKYNVFALSATLSLSFLFFNLGYVGFLNVVFSMLVDYEVLIPLFMLYLFIFFFCSIAVLHNMYWWLITKNPPMSHCILYIGTQCARMGAFSGSTYFSYQAGSLIQESRDVLSTLGTEEKKLLLEKAGKVLIKSLGKPK